MKPTKRDFARAIGLKLGKLNHLRESKLGFKCQRCFNSFPKKTYYFAEITYQELSTPIDTGKFILKYRPIVIARLCLDCSKKTYPGVYRKGF